MNRRQISFLAVLLTTMTTNPVSAAYVQTASAAAPPASATIPTSATTVAISAKRPPINPDDRVICETIEEIGSRLGDRKICMTRREWREQSNVRGGMQTTVVGSCRSDIAIPSGAKC